MKRNDGERFSIKQLEKTRKNLEARLKKLLESKTRDDVVTFEQLGVDRLIIDEAHNFKDVCCKGHFKYGCLLKGRNRPVCGTNKGFASSAA